jgi:hypothetical protein
MKISGKLLMKIFDVAQLAAANAPGAVAAFNAWRGKDEVDLDMLEKDLDEATAAHNRVQNA